MILSYRIPFILIILWLFRQKYDKMGGQKRMYLCFLKRSMVSQNEKV